MAVPARPIEGAPVDVAWGGAVHDTIVAQAIAAGIANVVIAAGAFAGSVNVTYSPPFLSTPHAVVATLVSASGAFIVAVLNRTNTGHTVYVRHRADAVSPGTVQVEWFAYGPRA